MSRGEPVNEFTILDWIGVIVTAGHIIVLFTLPKVAVTFSEMYVDFGGSLPLLTKIVTKPWVSILLGSVCLCIFSLQWLKWTRSRLKRRRTVVILSFLLASTAIAFCVVGFYLPIFKMAGAVG